MDIIKNKVAVPLLKLQLYFRTNPIYNKRKWKEVIFMSELQQKAVQMISGLSDDNISFLIEIINRLMPQSEEAYTVTMPTAKEDRKRQAFKRLDAARAEIRQYLPDDFDPERELEEARAERYGSIG